MNTPRCRHCGEEVTGELAQLQTLVAAASRSPGAVGILYLSTARTMLDELTEGLARARAAVELLEAERARTVSPAQLEIGGRP